MRRIMAAFRHRYGAHPLHLLGLLACFLLLGYVIYVLGVAGLWNRHAWWQSILVWFLGAIILHDLVLFPLYALVDRAMHRLGRAAITKDARVSVTNYVRLPTLGAALLFVLFFPGIIEQGRVSYHAATGQTQAPFLTRWLLITVALFVLSALVYLLRTWNAGAPERAGWRAARRLVGHDEQLLALASAPGGRCAAVASDRALYYRADEPDASWQRVGWQQLRHLEWNPEIGVLIIDASHEATTVSTSIPLVDAAELARLAHARSQLPDDGHGHGVEDATQPHPDEWTKH